jgi:hypothetical protein
LYRVSVVRIVLKDEVSPQREALLNNAALFYIVPLDPASGGKEHFAGRKQLLLNSGFEESRQRI